MKYRSAHADDKVSFSVIIHFISFMFIPKSLNTAVTNGLKLFFLSTDEMVKHTGPILFCTTALRTKHTIV